MSNTVEQPNPGWVFSDTTGFEMHRDAWGRYAIHWVKKSRSPTPLVYLDDYEAVLLRDFLNRQFPVGDTTNERI